jgi:hypothetical protein
MLKFIYEKKDEIPEGFEAHYTESNGKWVLECEGAVPKAKLDEFRANNTELKKQLDVFKDVDAEKYAELLGKEKAMDAADATNAEKVEALVTKRIEALKADHEKQVAELTAANETATKRLTTLTIDQALTAAGTAAGLRPTAVTDMLGRARAIWKLDDDGNPIAVDEKGEKAYGKTGNALTMAEYLESLATDAPHLFEENKGGGSSGGGKGDGTGTGDANPWKKESFNLTQQGRLVTTDPDKAKRLAAQAGVTLRLP